MQGKFVSLVILGIVIGSNNLAVALALGSLGQAARRFRVMLVFGLFEFFIPLLGIWLGGSLARSIGLETQGISAALLVVLGLLAVTGGMLKGEDHEHLARRVTNWGGLVILAAGLSTDNLLVGFSLGLSRVNPLSVALTIMVFSVVFTWAGMHLGRVSRRNYEKGARIGAGVLLVALGIANWFGWI